MASYKQKALALVTAVGATDDGTYFDEADHCWRMDYRTPKGVRWAYHGEHMSWQIERTLTECWKNLIVVASDGVEVCPPECDCWNG
jgi:hypothetical protein